MSDRDTDADADADAGLQGCWRLVSFETELRDSGERTRPWGAAPRGALVFTADGRMMVLVTANAREPGQAEPAQAALWRTMMAYTGRYRVEGDRFIARIDASWNEAWNGTEQERFWRRDGDALTVSTAWMPNPLLPGNPIGRGILGFRRESPGP
jgi:hypothetical protein